MKKTNIPEHFTVTAHTGCEGTKHNSLEAIQKGYDSGADIVEFDLNFTAEGEPVLEHDAPKPDSVPLKQAFELVAKCKGLRVNVDLKSPANLKAVTETAEQCGVLDRIFYTGVGADEEKTRAAKRDTPEVPFYLGVEIEQSKRNDEAHIRYLAALAKEKGALGLNIYFGDASEKLVKIFHQEGLEVSVWTVDEKEDMQRMLDFGCDNITTKEPSRLIEILKSSK